MNIHEYLSTSQLFKKYFATESVYIECCLILSYMLCCSGFPKQSKAAERMFRGTWYGHAP